VALEHEAGVQDSISNWGQVSHSEYWLLRMQAVYVRASVFLCQVLSCDLTDGNNSVDTTGDGGCSGDARIEQHFSLCACGATHGLSIDGSAAT
jgi:hypothetical protein